VQVPGLQPDSPNLFRLYLRLSAFICGRDVLISFGKEPAVKHLFSLDRFTDFGPNRLLPDAPPAKLWHAAGRSAALRTAVRTGCPKKPGVYGMLDQHGDLIYVGKAKHLRTRLLSYFRPRGRDARVGRIVDNTFGVVWEINPSEFAALHRELELIQRWRPRFNVAGKPNGWRYTYVCLGRKPAPYVYLAARPPASAALAFGPVPAGGMAHEAVRRANDLFRLRDCPQKQEMIFADQHELFPVERAAGCLRYEIGTCLGPCAAACTRHGYAAQVRAAAAFLDGKDVSALQALHRDMAAAAAEQAFERATSLRDKLEALTWLHEQLETLRAARTSPSVVYPVTSWDGTTLWYLIHGGRAIVGTPAPRDAAERGRTAALMQRVFRPGDGELKVSAPVEGVLLVASWFRRFPQERRRALTPEQALGPLP
jgi:excinuclease ABC subunit C